MGRITIELLRRRSEHNEGCLSTLQEIALHQQEIEKIELVGDVCRDLEILYLCNNYIPRIEGLRHLKKLVYLNLAVNNITRIEGLECCECLQKLDLTLNFINDLTDIERLCANCQLECLYLTGNPCTDHHDYRHFVINSLPQLQELDSEIICRSEKIISRQNESKVKQSMHAVSEKTKYEERIKREMIEKGIDPFPIKLNEKNERVYGHTPEERLQMLQEIKADREKRENPPKDPNSLSAIKASMSKPKELLSPEEEIAKFGRLLLRNEGKVPFHIDEEGEKEIIVTIDPGKFISTTLITVDVETTYLRVTIKGKLLQLVFQNEVNASEAMVQRSATTGQLKITIPLAPHVLAERIKANRRFANYHCPVLLEEDG